MKLDIEYTKFRRSEFEGIIFDVDLPEETKAKLGYTVDLPREVAIFGEYFCEWDDDIPMIQLTSLYIQKPDSKDFIDIDVDQINFEDIEESILNGVDAGEMYSEHLQGRADALYDSWKDSQYE